MKLAVALTAIAALGCRENKPVASEPVANAEPVKPEPRIEEPRKADPWLDAPRPQPPARPTPPPPPVQHFETGKLQIPAPGTPVEALVRDVRDVTRATAPDLVLTKIVGSYLRKDGTLDPTYGRLELELHILDNIDAIDDPNRPTGAPVPDVEPAEKQRDLCPTLTFGGGGWIADNERCSKMKQLKGGPRCTVAQIWSKAIAQGAPDNAVAIVQFDARNASWTFRITDKLRGVSFYRSYSDECTTAPAAPLPRKGAKPNPYDLVEPF